MSLSLRQLDDGRYVAVSGAELIDFDEVEAFVKEMSPRIAAWRKDKYWTETYRVDLATLSAGDIIHFYDNYSMPRIEVVSVVKKVVGDDLYEVAFRDRIRPLLFVPNRGVVQYETADRYTYRRNGRMNRDYVEDFNIDIIKVEKRV